LTALVPVVAMIGKDLRLFFSDRRAVIMSFAAPIAIASFFGAIFPGSSRNTEPARIAVTVVDEDDSAISRAIVAGARADANLAVTTATADAARERVRRGATSVAIVIPAGFGEGAGRAFFGGADKPRLDVLFDPSHTAEVAMVRGILTEHAMQAVSRGVFGGEAGPRIIGDTLGRLDASTLPDDQRGRLRDILTGTRAFLEEQNRTGATGAGAGLTVPYTVRTEAVTAGSGVAYNGYAHSFAGMGVQFLLFATANLGIELLLERQRGLWRRLRSAPVSRYALLAGKAASGALIALTTLLVSFAFAMLVFGVRIAGSVAGFLAVALACSLMAATFGLLVAAVGRTPATARGVTTFAVLLMVMLGGAWVPTFVFPAWLERLTVVVPARWAVDGLDAMTWRGLGLSATITPTLVLLAFAAAFGLVALARFRWEET
jgi:ABC-type multidrug transport system permease subunit